MINGVTELAMMKSDVLCGMDKVLVCTGYKVNGAITRRLPYDLTSGVEPVYEEVGGWPKSTASNPIPAELERYISIIEETVGVPVNLVSLGPDRAETIMRNSMIAH